MAHDIFIRIATVSSSGDEEELLTEGAGSEESVGSFEKTNHPDESWVFSLKHKITVPRDDRTGQITGSSRHHFLEVHKLIDKSSPLLAGVLVNPQKLLVEISFYRPEGEGDGGGEIDPYYQITLNNARITEIHSSSPDISDEGGDDRLPTEIVKLNYESIDWEHVVCSTTATHSSTG